MVTVLGASGFVGGHLVRELERRGVNHWAPERGASLAGRELGLLVYCAGVTADFRGRPLDTVEAHVGTLASILRGAEVESLVYLSSARVYGSSRNAFEHDAVALDPTDPDHLYNASKVLGEALALSAACPTLVMRPSNVFGLDLGSENFLPRLLRDAVTTGAVTLRTSLDSTRDYVGVGDLVRAVLALTEVGAQGIFNVAAANPVSHGELVEAIAGLTGCTVAVAADSPTLVAPVISTEKLAAAVSFHPEPLLDALPRLVDDYRRALRG